MTGRERIQRHLEGKPVDTLPAMPITMMWAADQLGVPYGRYVQDYRILAEAQILVAEKFDFDHVSVISDPAREVTDLGGAVEFYPDQPPAIIEAGALLADKTKLVHLKIPDPLAGGRMTDRIQGVALLKEKVGHDKYIEGWIEGPCAMGADLRGINTLMLDFYDDPQFVRDLFAFSVEMEIEFARRQIEAGVDIMGIGDAAASLVGPRFYEQFVWPYEKQLIDAIHEMGAKVRLHICGDTRFILKPMAQLGADMIDLDYFVPMDQARTEMGSDQVLLGNLDPVRKVRDGTPETVYQALEICYRQTAPRYIVGAGCEIARNTPEENIHAMVRFARDHRPEPLVAEENQ